MSVTSGGTTTGYVVDTSLPYASVVEEYSGTTLANGMLAARYDYGDDLIRMDRTTPSVSTSYYLFDGLGSTRQLVNTSGTVTDTWGYSAFGEQASRTGSTVNFFLFNAQQFDQPTGTYFLRARYYDQSNGRFSGQDPLEGGNEDPTSLHRYLYANNDPTNTVDPTGQEGELAGTLTAIGGQFVIAAQRLGPVFTAFNYITTTLDAIQLYQTYQETGKVDYKQLGILALDLATLGPFSKLASVNRVASHFLFDVILDGAPRAFGGAAAKAGEIFKAEQKLKSAGIELVKNADSFLNSINKGAGFNGASKQLFIRSNVSRFELFHEMQHFQHYIDLGADVYNDVERTTKLIKEEYVYENIMANAQKFNQRELESAAEYIQKFRDGELF